MDVKFIKTITNEMKRENIIVGNCIYFNLNNGNKAKTYCYEDGVYIEIINKIDGKIDCVALPFRNYFKPTQCSKGAPLWYQHIEGGMWYFGNQYKHVLPKQEDYRNLSDAMEIYIKMFE